MKNRTDPIIVLGMHRSGTTMLVKLLEHIDVYMGSDLDENHESKFYIRQNEWLMRQCSVFWDRPDDMGFIWQSEKQAQLITDYVTYQIRSPKHLRYTGLNGLKHMNWGFKDPRNTFTAEFWKRIYPNAKFIVMERDGMDVAQSLLVRKKRYIEKSLSTAWYRNILYLFKPKREPYGSSIRLNNIDDGIALWKQYVDRGRSFVGANPGKCMTICYEEFLKNPQKSTSSLLSFLELESDSARAIQVGSYIQKLDQSRANAYLARDPILVNEESAISLNEYRADSMNSVTAQIEKVI